MNKTIAFTLILVLSATSLYAQDIRQKLGKPSDYEMKMTEYPADTSATAVVLFQNTQIYYEMPISVISSIPFELVHDYEMRIKVLKPEGANLANVEIPYVEAGDSKERVRIVSATAYNLENGKVVKTELSRKDIFDEMVSKTLRLKKFSIPEVRVGTVIEYKYTITSNILQYIRNVIIQGNHPVLVATGEITIPEIFKYNINTTGYNRIDIEKKPTTIVINEAYQNMIDNSTESTKFSARDVPALKTEPNVWYPDDFRSKIMVELSGLIIPGVIHRNFSISWKAIDDQLEKGEFGSNLRMSCPFADEVKKLAAETDNQTELVRKILKLTASKIKWNGSYGLYADNIRRNLREGNGSSAAVNFVLNSALREAGFNTMPILLNPRHYGRMPYTHATLENINAFVIAVRMDDDQIVVVDATDPDNDVNVFSPAIMVDRAKIYGSGDSSDGWVNLSRPCLNLAVNNMVCEFNEDMELVANVSSTKTNLLALIKKKEYHAAASEEKYIEEMETDREIEIDDYSISDLSKKDVMETYTYRIKPSVAGDFIYINATVIPFMSESIFKQQERKMPVEFPYIEGYAINCQIKIPDGYVVEELPKNEDISFADSSIAFSYTAEQADGMIFCAMEYMVNRLIFTVEEYPSIFEIYGRIASASNLNIVLKKI